jgi:hypothetical protein
MYLGLYTYRPVLCFNVCLHAWVCVYVCMRVCSMYVRMSKFPANLLAVSQMPLIVIIYSHHYTETNMTGTSGMWKSVSTKGSLIKMWLFWGTTCVPGFDSRQRQGVFPLASVSTPDQLWGPPSLLSTGYQGSFPGGKAAGALRWSFTPSSAKVKNE